MRDGGAGSQNVIDQEYVFAVYEIRPGDGKGILHGHIAGFFIHRYAVHRGVNSSNKAVFVKSNAAGASQNPLYTRHALNEGRDKERRDAILRLRAEAKLKENEEFAKNQKRDAEQE